MKAFLLWTPRLLGAVTVVFLASFALDAFGAEAPMDQAASDFVMHLLPALAVAALVAIAWRYPVAGGLMLVALAAVPLILLPNPTAANMMLVAPVFISGLLFVVGAADRIHAAAA